MKKLVLTLAIVLGLGMTSFAVPYGGGMFNRGENPEQKVRERFGGVPILPVHGTITHQPATPLGSGIVLLTALGTAYLVGKKRREE